MKRFTIIAAVLFLALSGCSKKATEPEVGTIQGRVVNVASNAPISGAAITTSPASATATSDADGYYQIANVAAGAYTVGATKSGYAAGSISVMVYNNRTATANLSLVAVTSAPQAPVLVTPANGSSPMIVQPTLNWNPANGAAGYCVQISTDTTFTNVIAGTSGSPYNFYHCGGALAESTTYYWRANAANAYGTSAWSPVWSFTTGAVSLGNAAPNRPVKPVGPPLASRGQGVTFVTGTTDPDGSILYYRFDWGDGSPLVWSQYSYYGSQYSESHSYTRLGTFQVRAQAMDYYGATSAWSASCSLAVANVAPAVPSYYSPTNGSSIYSTYYTFQWSCTDQDAPYDTVLCDLRLDTLTPPVQAVATNILPSSYYVSYYVSGLRPTRTYYWQVVAHDCSGATTTGSIWSFVTGTK